MQRINLSTADLLRRIVDDLHGLRDVAEERAVRLEDDWGLEDYRTAEAFGNVQGLDEAIARIKTDMANL